MRCFELHRDEDASGISGCGIVAEGVQFVDGPCALHWIVGTHKSTALYSSIEDLEAIHGHEGRTRIVWRDDLDWVQKKIDGVYGPTIEELQARYGIEG